MVAKQAQFGESEEKTRAARKLEAAGCVVSVFLPQRSALCVSRQRSDDDYPESSSGLARLGFLLSLVSVTQVLRLKAMAFMCAW